MNTTTLEIGSAKITVPTDELFKAWQDKHINQPAQGLIAPAPRQGERYVGSILLPDRTGKYIYLRPEKSDKNDWGHQMTWAASVGGELPDRVEGALLFATMPEGFEKEAYWTREQHAADSDGAWGQGFNGGSQGTFSKGSKLRARVVRRELFTY